MIRYVLMTNAQRKAISSYRNRLQKLGMIRVEVHVTKDDAKLVRQIAKALSDPKTETELEVRAILRERFAPEKITGLKALLASAPLDGIDLSRARDIGRNVEL